MVRINRASIFILLATVAIPLIGLYAAEVAVPPDGSNLPSCVINAKDTTFAYLAVNQKVPVFIYFTDDSHEACKSEEAIVEDLAREYASKIRFVRVDASKCFRVLHANKITRLPAFCFVNRPAHATLNFEGYLDSNGIRGFIEQGLNPRSIIDHANAKYANREYKEAINVYTQATQIDPNNPAVYNGRGNARYAVQDYRGAVQDYSKVIEINPSDAAAYDSRAQARNAKDDLDGSIADFSKAIEIVPSSAELWNGRAFVKNKKGDYDGAIVDCSRAIEINAKLSEAYQNRGKAKLGKDDYDGAIADFRQVLSMGNTMAVLDIWVAQMRQGKKPVAQRELVEFLDKHPSHSFEQDCTTQIGSFLLGKTSADTLLSRMTTLDPGPKRNIIACYVYYYLGEKKLIEGDQHEATKSFEKVVATGETNMISYSGAMGEIAKLRNGTPGKNEETPGAVVSSAVVIPEVSLDSKKTVFLGAKKDASAFFHMGEMLEATCWKNYFVALGGKLNGSFSEMMNQAISLGAPGPVLEDIQRMRDIAGKIPFSVSKEVWTTEQHSLAKTCQPRAEVWNRWLLQRGDDEYLYFWLGRFSLRSWLGVQTDVVKYHIPISDRIDDIQSIVQGARSILVDKRYESTVKQLSMKSFIALKEMDSLEAALNTSVAPKGPTLAHINMLGSAGRQLRELNNQGDLVKQ
ncbi:MAG: tetratricopeptide repeat protein [Chthoniobacterales bacterium]